MASSRSARMSGERMRAHDRVDKIMDNAEERQDRVMDRIVSLKGASGMRESVDGYIHENPGKTVLIAAGIGAVLGAMLTAKMMRRSH